MKSLGKGVFVVVCIISFFCVTLFSPSRVMAVNAAFDAKKMGDMSD